MMTKTEFTTDWFTHNIPVWMREVVDRLEGPADWLELGSFEGRSARWVMENVTINRMTCVDYWGNHPNVERRFDHNTEGLGVEKVKSLTHPWLMQNQDRRYDVVYVDADHEAKSALMDAALAWNMLRLGGYMIFDDYLWQHDEPDYKVPPKVGIDAFLDCWKHKLCICHKGYQVIVRKTAS